MEMMPVRTSVGQAKRSNCGRMSRLGNTVQPKERGGD